MHALKVLDFGGIRERLAEFCETRPSADLAAQISPEFEAKVVWEQLDETKEAYDFLGIAAFPSQSPVKDLRNEVKRAGKGGVLDSSELYAIGAAIEVMDETYQVLSSAQEDHPRLAHYAQSLPSFPDLAAQIAATTDGVDVKDSASQELASLRKRKASLVAKVVETIQGFINGKARDLLSDPIYTVRDGRYVLPLKAEHRGKIKGIVHDTSTTGQTIFIEPEAVLNAANQVREVESAERAEIARILKALSKKVGDRAGEISKGLEISWHLDLIFAKARLAYEMKALPPQPLHKPGIQIENGRHPLLDPKIAVPLTINVSHGNSVLITGPNTGGKTVSIKTVGLFVLMAQCGMFCPAHEWKFCPFTKIWADIGDEQSLNQSLSTFSGHIKNIALALKQVVPGSIALLDEVGAGTDPAEGAALARAILEALHESGAAIIASTHYGELKAFAYEAEGFTNAAMEFDPKTHQPTYKLMVGAPGASHALRIAQKYGIPHKVIERAKESLGSQQQSVATMLESLEVSQKLARQAQGEADRRLSELKEQEARAARKLSEAEEIRKNVRAKTEESIEETLRDLRIEAETLFEDLKRSPHDPKIQTYVREGLRNVQERGKNLAKKHKNNAPTPQAPEKIETGMVVKVSGYTQQGVILEAPPGRKSYVQMGVLKMWIDNHLLSVVFESIPEPKKQRTGTLLQAAQTVRTEIHLRAYRAEEAKDHLEKFLDDANMAGLEKVRIVHGKGEGILRQMTHQVLKLRSEVADYHDADPAEGGHGVTLVTFKL